MHGIGLGWKIGSKKVKKIVDLSEIFTKYEVGDLYTGQKRKKNGLNQKKIFDFFHIFGVAAGQWS